MSLQRLKAVLAALILLICLEGGAARAANPVDLLLSLPEGIVTEEDGAVRLIVRRTMKIGTVVASRHSVSFASSDPKVATVGKTGLVTALKNGRATVSVTARDSKGVARAKRTLAVRVYTPLAKVSLPTEALLLTGRRKKLTAVLSPSTASDKALVWHSEDESVATVAPDGTVTAVAPGAAAIIAMSGGGQSASCAIRVADPAAAVEVDVPTGEAYLHLKNHLQLRAVVRPETAFEGVTWRSGNTNVVTVDEHGRAYGRKAGVTTVYAIARDGTGIKGGMLVRVITPVSSVKLAPTEKVFIGLSKKLAVKLSPSKPSVRALKWMSSDERVAAVSSDGTVTGLALGQVVITAMATDGSGRRAGCVLTVARPVTEISISPENGYGLVYKGEQVRLVADVSPADADDKSLKWTSSNSACAVVDAQGVVKGIRPGKARNTAGAKDGSGVARSVSLVVGNREKAITLNKSDAVIYANGETDAFRLVQLSAMALPSGTRYRGLHWTVIQGSSVTVDTATGLVTAVGEGVSTVQATTDNNRAAICRIAVLWLPDVLMLRTKAVTLAFGQRYDLGAEVLMDEACTERSLSWSSSNPRVATVTQNGVVTAAKGRTGTVAITAKSKNSLVAKCAVTVVKSLPKSAAMEAPSEAVQGSGIPPAEAAEPEDEAAQESAIPPEVVEPEGTASQGNGIPQEAESEGEGAQGPGIPQEEEADPEGESPQEPIVLPEEVVGLEGEEASLHIAPETHPLGR